MGCPAMCHELTLVVCLKAALFAGVKSLFVRYHVLLLRWLFIDNLDMLLFRCKEFDYFIVVGFKKPFSSNTHTFFILS